MVGDRHARPSRLMANLSQDSLALIALPRPRRIELMGRLTRLDESRPQLEERKDRVPWSGKIQQSSRG